MRILLVLDRVENPASANALMGFRLAEQLLRRDHTVHILTLWDGLHTPPAPPEGAMQHLLAFADERQMNEALENGQKGGTPVPLRLARLAAHPAAAGTVGGKSSGWTRNFTLTQSVPSARPTARRLRWKLPPSAERNFCGSWTPMPPTGTTQPRAALRGRGSCWTRWTGPSSRRRPCPTTPTAHRWPRGGKRYTFWAFQRCCRG